MEISAIRQCEFHCCTSVSVESSQQREVNRGVDRGDPTVERDAARARDRDHVTVLSELARRALEPAVWPVFARKVLEIGEDHSSIDLALARSPASASAIWARRAASNRARMIDRVSGRMWGLQKQESSPGHDAASTRSASAINSAVACRSPAT